MLHTAPSVNLAAEKTYVVSALKPSVVSTAKTSVTVEERPPHVSMKPMTLREYLCCPGCVVVGADISSALNVAAAIDAFAPHATHGFSADRRYVLCLFVYF